MKLSRRKFLGGAAAAVSSLTLFNFNLLTNSPPASASDPTSETMKTFRNVCPRNCYDTCGMITYVQDGILKKVEGDPKHGLSLIHISEPTRLGMISYAVFCLKKKKKKQK